MATTPIYGLPYQGLTDPPNGPTLGSGLAIATEAQLARIDAAAAVLANRISAFEAVWTFYTPTWVSLTGTNPTLASHSRTARYLRVNSELVIAQVRIDFGSSGYGTGVYALGLPFNATTDSLLYCAGAGHALDVGTAEYSLTCTLASVSTVRMFQNGSNVGAAVPFTFGNTDSLWASIEFEPA